jgi:hypothetical protein
VGVARVGQRKKAYLDIREMDVVRQIFAVLIDVGLNLAFVAGLTVRVVGGRFDVDPFDRVNLIDTRAPESIKGEREGCQPDSILALLLSFEEDLFPDERLTLGTVNPSRTSLGISRSLNA